jgi:hypothetical protein
VTDSIEEAEVAGDGADMEGEIIKHNFEWLIVNVELRNRIISKN